MSNINYIIQIYASGVQEFAATLTSMLNMAAKLNEAIPFFTMKKNFFSHDII